MNLSPDEAEDFSKVDAFLVELSETRWDVPKFARLLGVEVHPGQERFYDAVLMRDSGGVHPENLDVYLAAGNRAGKTLGLAVLLLHACMHKLGLPTPSGSADSLRRWMRHPFNAWHFGIQQEVADLVFSEIEMILDGVHPAQKGRGCPLTRVLGRKVIKTSEKEGRDFKLVKFAEDFGGAKIHFRTTNEKGVGQLGKDMNMVSYDECGFDNNLTFVVGEVLHMRRLSTAGQLILISTPSESFQQFADLWENGNPENPDRRPHHLSVRMSTRENIGYGISQAIFDKLVEAMPQHLVPQNVDGFFIQSRGAFFDAGAVDAMFVTWLPEEQDPEPKHSYVQCVDPALVRDATWSIVIDMTTEPYVGVKAAYREGKQSFGKLIALISGVHRLYSPKDSYCITAVDVTGIGKAFKDQLSDIHPLRSVEFGGARSTKMKLLTDLKSIIEGGRLKLPREGPWLELRRQLLGYRVDDRNLKTDGVMALAVSTKVLVYSSASTMWSPELPFDFYSEEAPDARVDTSRYPQNRWDSSPDRGNDELARRIRAGAEYTTS